MKLIIKAFPLFWLILIAGCSDDGKQAKAENTILKTQMDALKQAKKVDQIVRDTAAKRQEDLEKGAE
jgi:hypothetical protein